MSGDNLEPHDVTTPLMGHTIIDAREATTRKFRCPNCKTLIECPPIAPPLESRTKALLPNVPQTLGPFPSGAQQADTRKIVHPPEAPGT